MPACEKLEKLPWLALAALAALAPWLLGGRAAAAHAVLGTLAWGIVALAILAVLARWREWRVTAPYEQRRGRGTPSPLRVFGRGLLPTLPFLLLIALMAVSLLNPAYAWEGDRLVRQPFLPYLPTVIDPARSGPGIFFLGGLLAAAAVLLNPALRPGRRLRRGILLVLLANALVLCWTGLYFNLTGARELLGRFEPVAGYFFATFYYKNHWAAYALLYCGVAAAFFFRDLPGWLTEGRRAGSGALALIAIFFLGLTFPLADTRSGILLLGLLGALLIAGVWRRMPPGRARQLVAAGAVVAAAGFVALSASELARNWERTDAQIRRAGSVVAVDGIRLVHGPAVCLEMLGDRPLWGWGYLSFDPLFPVYATGYFRDADGALLNDMEFAHNDWLQGLAEFGWVGFALALAGAGCLLARRPGEGEPRRGFREGAWIWAGIGAVALFAWWDFPFSNPAVLTNAVALAVLVFPLRRGCGRG